MTLDAAHAAMTAAPEDDGARLAYFGVLADAPLWLWLTAEPEGTALSPRVFDLDDGPAVLAFDSAERLAEVAGQAAYAELPGRLVAQALAGQGVALGVNLGAEAPAFLVPPEAVSWLAALVTSAPEPDAVAGTAAMDSPGSVPDALVNGLEARLRGVAEAAVLVRLGGGLAVVVIGARAPEAALARAAGEAAAFSAVPGGLDVAFAEPGSTQARMALAMGRVLDVTPPPAPLPEPPRAPGSDPARPPKLR